MANQDGMLVRLGSVFYWLGCSLAAILVLIGLVVLIFTEDRDWQSLMIYAALSLIPAFLFWIVRSYSKIYSLREVIAIYAKQ